MKDINPSAEPTLEILTRSLAEMLRGRIGLFENEKAVYQADEARQAFADHLAEKHHSGHL